MAKQNLPGQHAWLEQVWPNDCCLCTHEATIAELQIQLIEARACDSEMKAEIDHYKALWEEAVEKLDAMEKGKG